MLRIVFCSALLCCALSLLATPGRAQERLPTPQLTAVFPPGGKVGTTFDIATAGADLDDGNQLLFSHPGITAAVKMSTPTDFDKTSKPQSGQFAATIAGDVPAGVYEARVVGRFGMSNTRPFVVSGLNEVTDAAGNSTTAKPLELAVGSVASGRLDPNQFDYLALPLKAGERVLLDVSAQRIDSRMDATLIVLNPQGKEIAHVRDTLGEDPLLDFTAPSEGIYTLKVCDAVYGGGPEYFYRLTVAAAPMVEFAFPPATMPGSNSRFTLYGSNLPGGQPAEGIALQGRPLQQLPVDIAAPGDEATRLQLAVGMLGKVQRVWQDGFEYRLPSPSGASNPITVYFARAPIVLEQEPNSEPAQAQRLTLPCEVNGQFYPAGDNDYFQFDAKKGEVTWIEVLSHQLGISADPQMTIQRVSKNEQGVEQVAEIAQIDDPAERQNRIGSDFDTSSDDPSYKFTAPEDGTYRVLVRDQFGSARRDPSIVYRLVLSPPQPDFRLMAANDPPKMGDPNNAPTQIGPLQLMKGGTALVQVRIDRRHDFTGEITVTAENLPAGVTATPAIVGGSFESTSLVLVAAENVTAGITPIQIVGKATIDGKEVVRPARYGQAVWGTANRQQQLPEFRLSTSLPLGIIDREMQPAFVQAEDKVWETAVGANLEIPLNVTRRGEFKEAIKLTGGGLPAEIRPAEVNVDGGAAQAKVQVQLNQQNIKPGTYTFYFRGDTKQKFVRNPEAIPAVEAEVKTFGELQTVLQQTSQTAEQAHNAANQKGTEAQNALNVATQNKTNAVNEQQQKANQLKAATDKLAQANDAAAKDPANEGLKNAATQAQTELTAATAQAKEADDKLAAADKALVEATAAQKAAEEARVKGEADLKAAQDKVNQGNQFKQQLDQRANQVRQANQPKDVNFAVVSTPVKLRIAASPITAAATAAGPIKQNEKGPLTVTVNRLYGFDQQVELIFEPKGVQGISANQVNVPNGQTEGKFEVNIGGNAPVGDQMCNIKVRTRWNNVQADVDVPVIVKVEAAAPAQ